MRLVNVLFALWVLSGAGQGCKPRAIPHWRGTPVPLVCSDYHRDEGDAYTCVGNGGVHICIRTVEDGGVYFNCAPLAAPAAELAP